MKIFKLVILLLIFPYILQAQHFKVENVEIYESGKIIFSEKTNDYFVDINKVDEHYQIIWKLDKELVEIYNVTYYSETILLLEPYLYITIYEDQGSIAQKRIQYCDSL